MYKAIQFRSIKTWVKCLGLTAWPKDIQTEFKHRFEHSIIFSFWLGFFSCPPLCKAVASPNTSQNLLLWTYTTITKQLPVHVGYISLLIMKFQKNTAKLCRCGLTAKLEHSMSSWSNSPIVSDQLPKKLCNLWWANHNTKSPQPFVCMHL